MKHRVPLWAAVVAVVVAVALTLGAAWATARVMLARRLAGEDPAEAKISEALGIIDKYYVGDWDEEKLVDGAVSGIVEATGDRWSYYMTADELSAYLDASNNNYEGIGVVIQKRDEGGVVIVSVYDVSPAAEAGIIPGSIVYAVDGEDITDYTLTEAKTAILTGLNQGQVTLDLEDPSGEKRQVTVKPGKVEINPVSYRMLENGVGYIAVKNFEAKCAQQMIQAMDDLRANGARSLLFDMRNNPGGQLSELLEALDYLLPEGTLFISNTKGGEPKSELSGPECVEMPMAVLVNDNTYSAAEFFAAALSEYDWADVVGEQTTGKGYAQVTIGMSDGSAIHISFKEYFTPKGVSLAGVGITPDLEIDLSDEDYLALYYGRLPPEDDGQLQAAAALLAGTDQLTP